MSDPFDPFEHLRRLAGDPAPTPEEERAAFTRLERVIAADGALATRRRWRIGWRWAVPAAAMAIVAALFVGVAALQPGAAEAALTEIAHAARDATPLDIPTGSFISLEYDATNLGVRPGEEFGLDRASVGYLLPEHVEVWYQPATSFYQRRSIAGEPIFFDDEVRAAWEANGGAERDQVGEVVFGRYTGIENDNATTDWPADADRLREALETQLALGSGERPLHVELFDKAGEILETGVAGPELRAAIAEMLAGLPLDLVERRPDGAITLAVTYEQNGGIQRDAITLGPDGTLIDRTGTDVDGDTELGIPPGTVVSEVTYQPPQIVTDLPES